jgi:hypothetical protein
MKKILTAGLLALSAALITDQQASAWVNCKFGVGLNWNWQSGGNNLLWGAFRNGQPPCPDVAHPGGYYGGGHPTTFPGTQQYGPQDFQYFGRNGNGGGAPAATPVQAPATQQPAVNSQVSWYGNSAYQQAGYTTANNPYYYYYYPQTYYGYQVPSYWYGR